MLTEGKGELVKGELHSSDAHSGVQIPLYEMGNLTARTLGANEYLVIHAFEFVTAAGGDCALNVNASATLTAGSIVFRGTFAATGGLAQQRIDFAGTTGANAFLTAPAGVVDIVFYGSIHQAESLKTRARYQATITPGT